MFYKNVTGSRSPVSRAVSAEVRAILGAKRLSGKKLAELMDLSQNYVAKRLRDEAPFTLDDIDLMVDALDLDYSAATLISNAYDRYHDDIDGAMFLENAARSGSNAASDLGLAALDPGYNANEETDQ
jgi:Helix-turn-helix.